MPKRYRFIFCLLAGLLLVVPLAFAQTTGMIEGTITDQSGAVLPGVTVEATSPNLQGSRTGVTGSNGLFRFVNLPPGLYRVKATLSGFGTVQKNAQVVLDATATVNIQMQLAAREAVTVSGEAPVIDTTSTTTGTNYNAKVIEKLPVGRNYADIIRSNPGVSSDQGETQGRALALTVYGATSVENQFVIDGINTTNVVKGFQGKALNEEFIQEVEVKTGGYQAEYGRALGGVVNVITKSGGNEFHGDAFVYYDSQSLDAKRKITDQDSLNGMRVSDYKKTDFGADLGGFFLKDRIWFFGAYDRINNPQSVSRYHDAVDPVTGAVTLPASAKFPADVTDNLYSAKLTFNATQSTSVVLTGFADPTVVNGAAAADPVHLTINTTTISSFNPATWQSRLDVGSTDYGARVNQLLASFGMVSLQASRHQDRFELTPSGAGAAIADLDFTCSGGTPTAPCAVPTSANSATGGFGEIFGATVFNRSKRDQYRGDLSFYLGSHEVKVGGDRQNGQTTAVTYYTGGQQVSTYNEYGTTYYKHQFFAVGPDNLTPATNVVKPRSIDTGFYGQDSWKILPSLTINAGLRWDQEDIRDQANQTVIKTTAEWQPRLGVVWDPMKDGTMKIYAFGGRFYYTVPTDLNIRSYGQQTIVYTYNFSPTDLTQDPTVFGHGSASIQGGSQSEPRDKNLKGIYQDEFTVGVEKALDPTFSIGLKGTYRRLGRAIEDRCDVDYSSPEANGNTCVITNPGSGEQFASGQFHYCLGLDGLANNCNQGGVAAGNISLFGAEPLPHARRLYRGIELLARKTFSDKLWAQASYAFSSLRGNYDGEVKQDYGQTDPGITADFDYAAFLSKRYGRLYLDRPHQARLDVAYTTPWKVFVGLQAHIASGAPLSKYFYFNGLYGGQVLADTANGEAGRLPTEWEANLSLGYPVKLGPVTVTVQAYVFNLFNNQIDTGQDAFWQQSQYAAYPQGTNARNCNPYPACAAANLIAGYQQLFNPNSEQTNPNYGKIISRQAPRLLRGAIKISF